MSDIMMNEKIDKFWQILSVFYQEQKRHLSVD
jgi:hypothetical protein